MPICGVGSRRLGLRAVGISMSLLSEFVIIASSVVPPAAAHGRLSGRGAARTFVSDKYRFSMAVPADWGVSTALDTPVFFYAAPGQKFSQDAIPPGAAVIAVEPQEKASREARTASTPETWAVTDADAFGSSIPSVERFPVPDNSGISGAVWCSYDEPRYSRDQRMQHVVAIFWRFDRKLFAAHLRYNAGDPSGLAFERVLFRAVRSIRPTEKP